MSCSDETESEPGFARNSSLTSPAMRSASGPVWQPVRAKHFTLPSECLSHWPEVISFPSPSARARQAGKMARRAAKAAKGSRQTGLFLSLLNRACSTTAEARQSEQRQTQLRIDYDQYRRTEAERLFDKLPAQDVLLRAGRLRMTRLRSRLAPPAPRRLCLIRRFDRRSLHDRAPTAGRSSLSLRPKKRGPFHLVPVIAKATLERLS
jgi:hypothetical protein